MMTERFYVDQSGKYLGSFDGIEPVEGFLEVSFPPIDAAQIWNGSSWSAAPIAFLPLTRRQLRRGLLSLGVRTADVEEKIAALPDDQREIALIDWQDASTHDRSHPLVSMLGAAFGLTEAQIDAAWLEAQEL